MITDGQEGNERDEGLCPEFGRLPFRANEALRRNTQHVLVGNVKAPGYRSLRAHDAPY